MLHCWCIWWFKVIFDLDELQYDYLRRYTIRGHLFFVEIYICINFAGRNAREISTNRILQNYISSSIYSTRRILQIYISTKINFYRNIVLPEKLSKKIYQKGSSDIYFYLCTFLRFEYRGKIFSFKQVLLIWWNICI